MLLTLNQVVKRMELLALSHKQINHFYFGDMVEWLANGEVKYPACFIDMATGSISKADKHTGWNFDVWFCDLADVSSKARANELEVQSDLTSIAEDYKAMLENPNYGGVWDIGDSSNLEYFKEKFEDLVIAVKMGVRLDVRQASDRCQIPAVAIAFTNYTPAQFGLLLENGDNALTELGQITQL